LSTALIGKEKANKSPDNAFLTKLEEVGFLLPFHGTARRHPDGRNVTFKKPIKNSNSRLTEINVKSFVFSLESEDETKTVDEWCKELTDVIVSALKKQDETRAGPPLRYPPKYSGYVPVNNLSKKLRDGSYSSLDNAITDFDVTRLFEWTAKGIDGILMPDGSPQDTIPGSAWQLTIYERLENLRSGFFTNWEETGFNFTPVRNYGFPLNGKSNRPFVKDRVLLLTSAWKNLDDVEGSQNNKEKYAPFLVSSFATLLRTTIPDSMTMIEYIQVKEFRASCLVSSIVHSLLSQLADFDKEFAKYALAFKDDIKFEPLPVAALASSGTPSNIENPSVTDGDANNKTPSGDNVASSVEKPSETDGGVNNNVPSDPVADGTAAKRTASEAAATSANKKKQRQEEKRQQKELARQVTLPGNK
jgi:hypothetical protein